MRKFLITAIIIVAIIGAAFGTYVFLTLNKGLGKLDGTIITLDINPSTELVVDEDNMVLEVLPLNEDADVLLEGIDYEGKNLEEVTEEIVAVAAEMGYLDEFSEENEVTVTAYDEDDEANEAKAEEMKDILEKVFLNSKVYAVVNVKMTDEVKTKAVEYDIAPGKMLLIERAIFINPELDEATLAELSTKEIQTEIKTFVTARRETVKADLAELKEAKIEARKQELALIKEQIKTANIARINAQKTLEAKTAELEKIIAERKEAIKAVIENRIKNRNSNN